MYQDGYIDRHVGSLLSWSCIRECSSSASNFCVLTLGCSVCRYVCLLRFADVYIDIFVFFFSPLAPLQNEIECAYYLRTGQCKFGSTCKFHHPQPNNMMVSLRGSPVYPTVQSPTTPSQQSYAGGITNWSRASFIPSPRWQGPSSYAPMLLPQGMVSVPGWNTYSVRFLCSLFSNLMS